MTLTDAYGKIYAYKSNTPSWQLINKPGSSATKEQTMAWRPYHGDAEHYSDPTGGMQDNMAYWRGAAASSAGLPLDAFEKPGVPDPMPTSELSVFRRVLNWLERR